MPIDLSNPQVTAALVAGVVALVIGFLTVVINSMVTARVASQKVRADRDQALSEKAWADYELRRDVYLGLAGQVDALFEGGTTAARVELNRMARRVRLVGSDQVVLALNELFEAIRNGSGQAVLERCYRALFNAMRRDIRELRVLPPRGTDLNEDAFPIEGAGG
ncbi:hypothetical protein DWF00_27185 [Bosea caraganae]|uniref:Uncharacterized protein n=1 Tax=Bosea caraganae TaxID=2763117 RepID=A0A370L9Q7_9HYPH|nr:hypothetical protein [Bosea caraganae]RDJ22007.1 hypothetical protein DWF00_27185 [Bosea caraganae]RDJ27959.1 hypothetical protein DWE98_04970 [Bosea caraganae]